MSVNLKKGLTVSVHIHSIQTCISVSLRHVAVEYLSQQLTSGFPKGKHSILNIVSHEMQEYKNKICCSFEKHKVSKTFNGSINQTGC